MNIINPGKTRRPPLSAVKERIDAQPESSDLLAHARHRTCDPECSRATRLFARVQNEEKNAAPNTTCADQQEQAKARRNFPQLNIRKRARGRETRCKTATQDAQDVWGMSRARWRRLPAAR